MIGGFIFLYQKHITSLVYLTQSAIFPIPQNTISPKTHVWSILLETVYAIE